MEWALSIDSDPIARCANESHGADGVDADLHLAVKESRWRPEVIGECIYTSKVIGRSENADVR